MSELEVRAITPEELSSELEHMLRRTKENKYAFQVGLKDLDFAVDEEKAATLGVSLPFGNIDQAEAALQQGIITPTQFVEDDDTEHLVTLFDPAPVGFSGFRKCVTHSLALTDQGLFEVGRYAAVNLTGQARTWRWFLHQRLATAKEVAAWEETNDLSPQQVVDVVFEAITGTARHMRAEEPPAVDG